MMRSTVRLTAAQALVRHLAAQHSERDGQRRRAIPAIWGIFGHGNVCGLGEALATGDGALAFHQPRNEQAMVHAALGFAKATRRLAAHACTASIGPGSTNMVTGAATATTNRLPVLLLPADTFANRRQGPVLQQLEHPGYADWSVNECLRPVSRYFDRIARPEQLLTALPEAMRVLLDPAETGAVTIALHQDVQGEAYDYPAGFFAERTWAVTRRPAAAAEIARVAALLREARRPLVIAGGGARHSGAEAALAALADGHGLAVAETSAGKGAYLGERQLGGIGVNGTAAANVIAAEADVVLCVGTRLSDFTTASHSLFQHPGVRFAAVNVCPADAAKLGALPVIADAREGLAALHAALGDWRAPDEHREAIARAADRWREALGPALIPGNGERLLQGQVLHAVTGGLVPGDWVVAAAGGPPGDLLKLWEVREGTSAHLEFGFSCMGHELPAAIGLRLGDPGAGEIYPVIGDGTWLMGSAELATAVQAGLKVTVILLVNGGYQSIHGLQLAAGGPSFGNEFRDATGAAHEVDFAANARSLGAAAWDVRSLDDLGTALAEARAGSGPGVIVCHVEARRALPSHGAFWDLGVAEVSRRPEVSRASAAHIRARSAQRHYGWTGG
jgi:3D-(3,5/4)-trihydroxycyclohexane-1,2-dione acylhydrolase (decyclizing)